MENTHNQDNYSPQEFPVVDENQTGKKKSDKKGYQNFLYPNDSVRESAGFINEIRCHEKDGEKLYFVRAGLLQGSKKNDQTGEWEGDIVNVDLLVGPTLKKWAETSIQCNATLSGVKMRMVVRNLKFAAGIYDGKPVLDNRGTLEEFKIGHLDR